MEFDQIALSRDNVQFKIVITIFFRVANTLQLSYRLGT
jgi:hypothetical protein